MAGSVIGALRVNLGLDSAQFIKGTKNAEGAMKGMSLKMAAAGAAITAAVGAIAATFGTMTADAIKAASEVGKVATALGMSTQEFQRAAFAAKAVNIESEKLADIYKDVNDKFGEFLSTGGGELKDFFDNIAPKVGVTAEQFRNLSGPQALQLYVSTLEQAGVNSQEMTFYLEALANDASRLAPLLANNGEQFRKLGDEAERLGLVISNETSAAAQQFSANMQRLKGVGEGLALMVAAELLPHLVRFTNWLIDNQGEIVATVGRIGDFISGVARMASAVANGVAWMEERFGRLGRAIGFIINPLSVVVNLATRLGGGGGGSGGPLGQSASGMMQLATQAVGTARAMRTLGVEGDTAGKALGGSVGGGARAASAALKPMRDEVQDLVERLFPELGTRAKMAELALLDQAAAQGKITEQMRAQGRLRVLGANDNPEISRNLISEPIADAAKEVMSYKDDIGKSLQELEGKSEIQTVAIADNFAQMSQRIVGALQGLTNSIRSGDFLGILGGVLDIFTQLGSAGVFGPRLAGRINAPRSFDGGGFTGMGARAGGLDGKGGFLAMLHPRESVIDHTKGGMGGGQIHVTVGVDPRSGNLTAFVDNRFAAMAPAVGAAASAEAVNRIQRMQSRRLA